MEGPVADRFLVIIAQVVTQMAGASEFSAAVLYERLLALLVDEFEADGGYLRHYSHALRASMLIAEWPRNPDPERAPRAKVAFVEDDVALAGDLKAPTVIAVDGSKFAHSSGSVAGHGRASYVAVAPLLWGTVTTGVIGLTRSGGNQWVPDELDALGVLASLFAQLQARIAAESRLHRLAERDDLTGLHNRRALTVEVRRRLRAGRPGPVAALYIDLDRLKSVNDHLGHDAGDVVIRTCAQRLRAKAGQHAMIARVGGDEFVVVPHDSMSVEDAERFAHTLRTAMCSPIPVAGERVTRTVSIGVAVGMPGIDTSDDLLRRADHVALAVKRKGGNAVVAHDVSMSGASRSERETGFLGGINSEALQLRYQPEIDLRTGEILATEALVCWQPTRGLPADVFNGAAQLMALSRRSAQWVMRRACSDFSTWRSHGIGRNVTLRLNISPAQLVADDFVEGVASTIDEFGIDASSVCLEIRERAMMRDIQHAHTTLAMLKDIGVQIAIDDFGIGDVALPQLKSLPIDMLNINTEFIRDLGNSAADLAIVQAIVGLAETAGVQLTAEGVETPIAATTLVRHGCNRAQGLLLSRPVTGDVMESLLSSSRIPLPYPSFSEAVATLTPLAVEDIVSTTTERAPEAAAS